MKNILIIAFTLFAAFIKAQDSTFCYNSGNLSSFAEDEAPLVIADKKQNASLILMPGIMNKKEIILVLKEKEDVSINKFLKKVRLSRNFKGIGFSAIPEALLGAGFVGAASVNNRNSHTQKIIGFGLIAASAVCLSSSLCLKVVHTKNYKRAIARYNELYN